jgi:tRNA nucleotidyltransferase (CCA-adding enzyme)
MNLASLLEAGHSVTRRHLDWLRAIADRASALGMPAYLAGGPVRDLLLARPVRDFDLVVEGDAVKLGRVLVRDLGGELTAHKKFHTAAWSVQSPEAGRESLDLITARSESYPRAGALPDVTPATIEDDLRRRDFTINSMAVRLDADRFGDLLDPLGGQADLSNRSIRILHERSFVDDPTRMLRAVRYAVRYGYELHPETRSRIDNEARGVLSGISGERLRHEFDLIFEEERPSEVLASLADFHLPAAVHPHLGSLDHRLPALALPPVEWGEFKTADILSLKQMTGWTCWLAPLAQSALEEIAARLSFPTALDKAAQGAASILVVQPGLTGSPPSRWTFFLDGFPLLSVYAVWLITNDPALREYLGVWRRVHPITRGDDLTARGLTPGPDFQTILSRLRAARLDGEVGSDEEEVRLLESLLDPD